MYNILSAVAASLSLGVPWHVILGGVQKTGNIAGRFEKIDAGQKFLCIVDYAHTEDALERLILTAREIIEQQSAPQRPALAESHYSSSDAGETETGARGLRWVLSPRDSVIS